MFQANYFEVEASVRTLPGNDQGLESGALLTSKEDFEAIFNSMATSQKWIELGSGHGLGPLLFAHLNPTKTSVGIEFEKSRYEISQKLKDHHKIKNCDFKFADLLSCDIPVGDVYFFYFPTGMVLDRVLSELKKMTHDFSIVAIESHGDFLPRLKKENWLSEASHIPLSSPRHTSHAVVFTNNHQKPESSLHDLSFERKFFLIEENDSSTWIGESYGLEWTQDNQFQCLIPPRSFHQDQVKKIFNLSDLEAMTQGILRLRALGQLKILTDTGMKEGFVRKIYQSPSFKLEISSGEQVEWVSVRQIFWESTLCYDSSSDYFFYPHVV